MTQPDAWRMIRRRAIVAGIHTPIGNHSFRATGITAYLANGSLATPERGEAQRQHSQARQWAQILKRAAV